MTKGKKKGLELTPFVYKTKVLPNFLCLKFGTLIFFFFFTNKTTKSNSFS
jgi:hypothetical protein